MQVKSECWQSDELYNSAVVVVVQRNAGSRIVRALASVYRQDYEDIGVLFIDDASTDDTRSLASDFFAQNMVRGIKVAIHFNVSPTPKIASLDTAIRRVCKNPESVIFWLDGDDELLTEEAIRVMMDDHRVYDVVWSQHEFVNLKKGLTFGGFCAPMESDFPRQHRWVSSHLKSFKNYLFQQIENWMLRDDEGVHYPFAVDRVIMYLLIEMVGKDRCFFRDKVYYRYYHATPEPIVRLQKECVEKLVVQEPLRAQR